MNAPASIITRALSAPASWNPEERSFVVTFATENAVPRRDARGPYLEVLSMTGLEASASVPALDSHARDSLERQIGRADSFSTAGGEAAAKVWLSRANPVSDRIGADLSAGQSFGVSCGYVVHKWKESTVNGVRTKTATRWTLVEISLVPIPADSLTGIRGFPMTVETTPAASPEVNPPAAVDRAAVNQEIRSIARVAGLDQSWIDGQIDAAATVDGARAAAFDSMRQRSAQVSQVRTHATVGQSFDDPEFRARTIGEALFTRIDPAHTPSEPARAYVGLSIAEIARDCVRSRGYSTTGLSSATIIERALQSTSDFPLLLADTVGRTLRQSYQAAPAGIRQLGRQTTARDFRAKHRLQFSAAPTLEPLNEAGEFKSGAMAEAQEGYSVSTFGKIIGFTRQAMVNDDLGAFGDISRRMGQAAAAFENNFLAKLLASNPVMSDGKTLFHSAHGNANPAAAGFGPTISAASISTGRQSLRLQTGLLGELIAVTPRFILCGADRETEAEKAVASITPVVSSEVNPFAGKLQVVVDPRISGDWYLVADPSEVDGLEFAYLEGAAGPQITSELGFDVDGIRFRVRLDFGAGFVDWRGWYHNPAGELVS